MQGRTAAFRGSRHLEAEAPRRAARSADAFAGACRWLPLVLGLPFALMIFAGILFNWL